MPWTLAHAAAVLPLRRWPALPFAGLVAGSMAPDFGYYTGHFELAKEAHTPLGVLWLCLPTSLLVVLLLRWWRPALVELLPQPHRGALASLPARAPWPGWRGLLALAAAIVAGAATHVVWDSFTHEHAYAVQSLPLLQRQLFAIGGSPFLVYNTLQHASSVFGVLCLFIAYRRWLQQVPRVAADDGRDAWRIALLVGCAVVALLAALPIARAVAYAPGAILVRTVIFGTSNAVVLLLLAAWGWSRWGARRATSR
jgi:hypothetical protein